ncbi:MAG: Rne/Rng family ribonuclease [Deltaproteobacteria bacterium]|nr:Rne/Rng family ribonuclease [Deltaproteobacteria bacterium]
MQNEIIINAERGETRVALLESGQFAELHIERERDKSVVGNVVKGRVSRVLPGMQAAFVDIGLEKAAFLYVGDYFESTFESGDDGEGGGRGRRGGGRGGRGGRSAPPRIDTVLHEGQEIIVQIAKEPIGTKGARITSNISIPGRHLVLTPWSRRVGVSRRIGSDKERRRLREIVERLRPPQLGFIIRTAGDGVREADLQADIRYLATVWAAIQKRNADKSAPAILYSEHDLPLRIVRDLAGPDTKRIIADDKTVYEHIQHFVDRFVAEPKPQIELYEEPMPIFDRFGLEHQIHANLERKVWLKSGGSLVIDKTEALTSIDVNTGRFVGKRDLEETVFKTNLEAVQEVVRQLRFRNLGGLIIIDLIDMESASNRDKVYRALQEALRADKARTNILKISELGLVEMTRKRTRENLVQTLCEPCSHCEGRSYVLSRESVAFRVLREVRKHLPRLQGRSIAIAVNPHVAEELLIRSKQGIADLSRAIGKDIEIRARPGMHQEQFELLVLEAGPPVELELSWLRSRHPDAAGDRPERGKRGRRRRGGRGRHGSEDAEGSAEESDDLDELGDEIEEALDAGGDPDERAAAALELDGSEPFPPARDEDDERLAGPAPSLGGAAVAVSAAFDGSAVDALEAPRTPEVGGADEDRTWATGEDEARTTGEAARTASTEPGTEGA